MAAEKIIAKYTGPFSERQDNGWLVILARLQSDNLIRDALKIIVIDEGDRLVRGTAYYFFGSYFNHPQYGRQFNAESFVVAPIAGREGVVRYLQKAPHIGSITAGKLWAEHRDDAIRVVREDPRLAVKTVGRGLTLARARKASQYLQDNHPSNEQTIVDLTDIIAGQGFPQSSINAAVAIWGEKAPQLIRRNAYLTMRLPRVRFGLADKLFLHLGGNPARLKRQVLCMANLIDADSSGHTWFSRDEVAHALGKHISGAEVDPDKAIRLGVRAKLLYTHRDKNGQLFVTYRSRARDEQQVADIMVRAQEEELWWPELNGLAISPHQLITLGRALTEPISILGGSPGSGKSFVASLLALRIIATHGIESICAAAPTGKAAARLTELFQTHGVPLRAMTIHRLLSAQGRTGDRWDFAQSELNPNTYQYLIIDEASMIDVSLMASLLSARPDGGHILLLGDTSQLPPVGHGAVLRDLINAGVPYAELTEPRRHAGTIATVCRAIRDGERFETDLCIDVANYRNLQLVSAASGELSVGTILSILNKMAANGRLDPVRNVQVVTAVNQNTAVSRTELNRIIRDEFNSLGAISEKNPFRAGDKVIYTRNGMFRCLDADDDAVYTRNHGQTYVANGEIGFVEIVKPRYCVVNVLSPYRQIEVRPTKSGSWLFELAYAVTVHKAQGSEWQVVIVAIDDSHAATFVTSREWAYTAISRAKKACIIVGKRAILDEMCRRTDIDKRQTFLQELIECQRQRPSQSQNASQSQNHDQTRISRLLSVPS